MDKKEIEKKVKEILADRLDIDIEKINLNSNLFNDLGMDSFLAVEFIFELKKQSGVILSDKELPKMKTVKDIIDNIYEKVKGAK